ncbi:MAG: DNA polymerase IV, partial [Corynebacterium sp.]|nr:DNA polymerase IV [Corynebacterium sp.]
TARQDVLFPEFDQPPLEIESEDLPELTHSGWRATQDVYHPDFGHGWIQGTGHGFVSVRFETRATGPGPFKSFAADDPQLSPADPLDSLAWDIDQ